MLQVLQRGTVRGRCPVIVQVDLLLGLVGCDHTVVREISLLEVAQVILRTILIQARQVKNTVFHLFFLVMILVVLPTCTQVALHLVVNGSLPRSRLRFHHFRALTLDAACRATFLPLMVCLCAVFHSCHCLLLLLVWGDIVDLRTLVRS